MPDALDVVVGEHGHHLVSVVRVDADRAPQIVVRARQGVDGWKLFQRGADAQGPVDAGLCHRGTDLGKVGSELGKAQVAVGVDVHGFNCDRNRPAARAPPA